jgi:hypothetical protein
LAQCTKTFRATTFTFEPTNGSQIVRCLFKQQDRTNYFQLKIIDQKVFLRHCHKIFVLWASG